MLTIFENPSEYENDLKHFLAIIGYYGLLYTFNKIHFIEMRNKI